MGHPICKAGLFGGGGEAGDLLEVVEVVAGHGFDDGPEGHGAAFGVGGASFALFVADFVEQQEVPGAGGFEEVERGVDVEVCVALRPFFLVEGLDHRMVFGEGLAEAEAEDDLAIGEVGNDLAGGPLCAGLAEFNLLVGDALEQGVQFGGGLGDDFEGIAVAQEVCVGVQVHADSMTPRAFVGQ